MQYTILEKTDYLLQAYANNQPIKATQFGIGIGSNVNAQSRTLDREVYRGPIKAEGRSLVDGTEYLHITGFIPPSVGDIAITEIGIYDDNGNLLYFAHIDPPVTLNKYSYVARLLHMFILYDTVAAAVDFETGLTSIVEHNQDPNAHPDIREHIKNIESRLLPEDVYADIFAVMSGTPVTNALTVIEYDPESVANPDRSQWRPLRVRQTISPYSMLLYTYEYDLTKSARFPVKELVQTKYFIVERRAELFNSDGMPTHIVFECKTEPILSLNPELKKLIAGYGYPPTNFAMTVVYDEQLKLPNLITITGEISGNVEITYDPDTAYPSQVSVDMLNGQINFTTSFDFTIDNDGIKKVVVQMPEQLVSLVKTTGTKLYGIAMMLNSLLNMFSIWNRVELDEYQFEAYITETEVKHVLIVNGQQNKPVVYNYWAESTTDRKLIRGYALSVEYWFGKYTAVQRLNILA